MIDFKQQKILVQDTADQYSETLVDFDRSSVKRTWKKNQSYQLELTAANDDSLAYSILRNENSLLMGGQEYVIKQVKPDLKGYSNQVAITANHIYYESRRIWQYQKRAGTITYSIQDILHYFFDNNPYGFTWEVIGDFSKVQIENLGNTSALDALNTCVDKFNCVIYPDNKHIRIYSRDAWQKKVDKAYLYGHNTTTFSCSWDTTSIQNVAMCYGKQKDGEENQYYFPPFLAKNTTSIQRWGERPGAEISDERFTEKNAMNAYAMSSMQADPVTTMALTYDGDDQVLPGEVWYLRVEPEQFNTDVEVTGITDYPFAPDHKPEVELDNSVRTLLDEDIAQERLVKKAIKHNQLAAQEIKATNEKAVKAYDSRFIGDLYGTPTRLTRATGPQLPGYILKVPADNPDLGLKKDQQFYAATAVNYVEGLAEYVTGMLPVIPDIPKYETATPTSDGLMSATDKVKLDQLKIEPVPELLMTDKVDGSIYVITVEKGEIKVKKGENKN
ncbi:phage tail protein [Latilactobacillus sakei]|uniref:phage tail protein n=1 Tax=Latilactobacillus sakei TaxID=1599 RepID=UPI003B9926D4